jgi:hypothetical protein
MLGGLARWLRAAGHDATWIYGIEDQALVDLASREGRTLLTSDAPLARAISAAGLRPEDHRAPRAPISGPLPTSLFIPRGLKKQEQLRHVLRSLAIPVLPPRCMPCGGPLVEVPREAAAAEAPPRSFRYSERFWRCGLCGKLFWEGSHWETIRSRLAEAAGGYSTFT